MWLVWDDRQKKMRHLSELDPRYADRELYTADRINEQRQAQLGELSTGDDRPQLLLAQDGDTAEALRARSTPPSRTRGSTSGAPTRRCCRPTGSASTSARRDPLPLRPDARAGRSRTTRSTNGQPVVDPSRRARAAAEGPLPDGTCQIRPSTRAAPSWEPLSAFNLLSRPASTTRTTSRGRSSSGRSLLDEGAREFGPPPTPRRGQRHRVGDRAHDLAAWGRTAARSRGGGDARPAPQPRLAVHLLRAAVNRNYPTARSSCSPRTSFRLLDVREQLAVQAPDKTAAPACTTSTGGG
jgi:hypothetical protein